VLLFSYACACVCVCVCVRSVCVRVRVCVCRCVCVSGVPHVHLFTYCPHVQVDSTLDSIVIPSVMISTSQGEELKRVLYASQDFALTLPDSVHWTATLVNFTYRGDTADVLFRIRRCYAFYRCARPALVV
jgi:hypothetical protein